MDQTMANQPVELKKSRSGRLLIPRLKTWTGERVVVRKKGVVEILDGAPDCTSTFQTERSLFKNSSLNFSHSVDTKRTSKFAERKLAKSFCQLETGSYSKTNTTNHKDPRKIKDSANQKIEQRKTRNSSKNFDSTTVPLPKQVPKTPAKTNLIKVLSPGAKNLRKHKRQVEDQEIDIFGTEFQPFVSLVKLLPEEILTQSRKELECHKNNENKVVSSPFRPISSPKTNGLPLHHQKKSKLTKLPNPQKCTGDFAPEPQEPPIKFPRQFKPRTVRDTQKMLAVLNEPGKSQELEDEAASTAAFFQSSPSRKSSRQLRDAVDILQDDCESDDNLSIRTLSERESSPMSSAVSPIGSLHETDAELSGWEDGLLGSSPAFGRQTSFQRARLLHKTLKDKEKLLRNNKSRKKNSFSIPSNQVVGKGAGPSPGSCQLLQPKVIRALEKDLKKKAKSSKQWDFSTYYRGNVLHVSVNSDSDSESSADSFDEF